MDRGPGEDVWSSFPENTYRIISGTSTAAPHVAERGFTAAQTRTELESSAVAGLSTNGRRECASYPALNLANSLS